MIDYNPPKYELSIYTLSVCVTLCCVLNRERTREFVCITMRVRSSYSERESTDMKNSIKNSLKLFL